MEMLSDLHKAGSTICMVTHDPRYAQYAQRSIHLFDGRVVEDEQKARKEQETAELRQSGFEVTQ